MLLSLLPEKKPRYLLPILIPACYVMAVMLRWWRESFRHASGAVKGDKVMFRINCGLIALVVLALPVLGWFFAVAPGYMSVFVWVILSLIFVSIAIILFISTYSLLPNIMVFAVTVAFMAAECLAMPSVGNIAGNPERHSIALSRDVDEIKDLPFYHLESEPLRIEMVYAANKKIRPLDFDTLERVVPCVLLTHKEAVSVLDSAGIEGFKVKEIDYYDDNRLPRDSRRYNPDFLYHLTIIEK